jgi:hypothetical protein
MALLANPWAIVTILVALGTSHIGAYLYGGRRMEDAILADELRQEQLAEKFEGVVAENISKMKVVSTTIYQRATREVVKEPVYVDCVHTDNGLQLVNSALTNKPIAAGGVELSEADTAGGEHVRGDDAQTD